MLTLEEKDMMMRAIREVRVTPYYREIPFSFRGHGFVFTWRRQTCTMAIHDACKDGKKIFSIEAEFVNDDTLAQIFANYLEYYIRFGKTLSELKDIHKPIAHVDKVERRADGSTIYYCNKYSSPTTTYYSNKYSSPATTHYISLEERVKRLEKRTDDNERSRDYLMKELAQRKDLEEKLEKTFDKIYDIVEEWEEDWSEHNDNYWMQSIKDALDEIEED